MNLISISNSFPRAFFWYLVGKSTILSGRYIKINQISVYQTRIIDDISQFPDQIPILYHCKMSETQNFASQIDGN